jgi:hypothetical protein
MTAFTQHIGEAVIRLAGAMAIGAIFYIAGAALHFADYGLGVASMVGIVIGDDIARRVIGKGAK